MAWEQILTDGTPTNKLSDVNEAGSADGDLLIWSAEVGDVGYKTNTLGGDDNEITITNGYGTSSVGLHDTEVVIPAKLKVTSEFKLGDDIIRTNDGTATITIDTSNDAVTLAGDSFTLGSAGKIVDSASTMTITKTNIALAGAGSVSGALTVGGGYGSTGTTISGAGAISTDGAAVLGSTLDVTGDTTITADLVVNGGAARINAITDSEDASLTIAGGATDKDAIINLHPDQGVSAGDEWEIRAANGGVLSFKNDKAEAGELDAMMTFTPLDPVATSKLVLAGDLHVGGDLIKLGGDSEIGYTTNKLTLTEATIDFQGAVTASSTILATTSVTSALIEGSTSVQTPLIQWTDGDDAITIADGGAVATDNTLTVGTDLTVNGSILGDADEAKDIFAATTTDANFITIGGGGRVKTAGDLQVQGNDVYSSSSNCLSLSGSDVDVIGELKVRGNAIHSSATNDVITFIGTNAADVKIDGNLTVSGATTTIDTATIMLEDNLIYMNSGLAANVAPTADAGLTVNRGSATHNASFFWDESSDGSTSTTSNNASATPGGAWAMGYTESAASGQTTISNVTGWVVGVTHAASGTEAADARATGLGSLFINTDNDEVYIRVS